MEESHEQFLSDLDKAESIEELLEICKANDVTMTEDEARAWFARKAEGEELSDEALDEVAGGFNPNERRLYWDYTEACCKNFAFADGRSGKRCCWYCYRFVKRSSNDYGCRVGSFPKRV